MSAPTAPSTPAMAGKPPSPELLFENLQGFYRTEVLKAAIELEIFTAIGEGNKSVATIAQRVRASERGVRILCDYLVTIGFLNKAGQEYALTPDSAMFLDRRSPAYTGGVVRFLLSPQITEPFHHLAEAVRKGGTVGTQGTLEPNNSVWVDFARAMAPLTTMSAEMLVALAAPGLPPNARILDIAASHGLFGIAFARKLPGANVAAVDWENVLEVAKENALKAGVTGRYRLIPGSAFDVDFGSGYDLVLITNFLHHFNPETNVKFLRKVHAALAPNGRALTLDFIPNEDRITPAIPARFSLQMLGGTPDGDTYTVKEFQQMFASAGFSSTQMHELPPTFQRALLSQK